ncbi:RNA polymerase sigma factor [Gemmatimonadota bacterium]
MKLARSSDFDALFQRVYPPLFRYCHRMTGDPDQADDLAQEAFFRLWDRGIQGPEGSIRVWLFRVATNLARDGFRARERRRHILTAHPTDDSVPGPDREMERNEEIEKARRALGGVPDRDREILLLRQEGFSYKEIADAVGVAPTSVGTLLARALRRFGKALSDEEHYDGSSR